MAEYFNVTTNLGDAEVAAAITNNSKINITHIAFGDGNGSVPTPNKSRTSLVREVHRQPVTKYERHPTNQNWIIIETVIPSEIGGFTIREMGIIGNGKLLSHGSHAPFEKVADPSGVSEYRLKFTQNITDGNVVAITLDDSLIFATQAWVEENFIKRSEIVDNLVTNDATKPVSAKQAKKLQDEKLAIASLVNDLTTGGNKTAPTAEVLKTFFQMFSTGSTSKAKWLKIANASNPTLPYILQFGTTTTTDSTGEFIWTQFPIVYPTELSTLLLLPAGVLTGLISAIYQNNTSGFLSTIFDKDGNKVPTQTSYYLAIGY